MPWVRRGKGMGRVSPWVRWVAVGVLCAATATASDVAPPAVVQPEQPLPKPADPPRDTTRDPLDRLLEPTTPGETPTPETALASYVYYPTLGFAGQSGVAPRSGSNDEFDTVEDRWRIGFPAWDRYGLGHPRVFDYPYQLGRLRDPYRQN